MTEVEKKLVWCFSAVLPEVSADEIPGASASSVASWDSVATVSLLAVIEQEFGIEVDPDDLSQFDSFRSILAYLNRVHGRPQAAVDFV